MKIALFTDTYLPNINGVVTSVELLRKKLEEKGHIAYVISTYSGIFEIKQEGRIIRLPGLEIKKLYGYSIAQPIHLIYIDKIKELELDLIHCHTEFGVGIFANIVAKQLHLPIVRTYHTTYEDYTHYLNIIDSDTFDAVLKKAVSGISKYYGDNCRALIAPSTKTKELLLKYNVKTPITVIPTGIELEQFKYKDENKERIENIKLNEYKKEDNNILLFVGRIAKEKSIDMIIKAFKYVKDNKLKIKLVIIGDGPDINELKNLTNDLLLNDYIIFLGKKPYEEIHYYYQAADGFISASTSETQGMTYLEALASKLIVFGRYDEVLEDLIIENENGYFFNDEDDLFNKINLFNNLNKEQLKIMKDNAYKATMEKDANVFVNNIISLYEKVINDFENAYMINKVKLKDDIVIINLSFGDNDDYDKLAVSLDSYYAYGLRNKQKLSFELYDILKEEEDEVIAYNACLKKLANKDYTVKQIYDFLAKKYNLKINKTNHIIDKLKSIDLLNDEKYALNKIGYLDRMLYSQKMIINKLKKDGVPLNIIESFISKDNDKELEKALNNAKKYQNTIKNKSLQLKKHTIIKKLINDGFNYDDANKVIRLLDFTDETFEEKDLLKKEANKIYLKLKDKYQGYELRNKLYYSLHNKGFLSEAIYAIIDEMELKNEQESD